MNDNLMTPNNDPVHSQHSLAPDPNVNYLNELVGEGKKFKSSEDLAKGKYEADQYVKTLERQLDEMRVDYSKLRDDYNSRAKLEELIDQIESRQQQQQLPSNPPPAVVPQQPSIDPKQIESLVSSKIMEHESSKAQQQNFNFVRSKLEERFGRNYQETLKQQVNELGLTEDFVNDLAKKHPQVLLKTLGLDQPAKQQNFQAPPRNERSDHFQPTTQKRTWSYYQQLKKADPKIYYDPKTQVQMHKDAIALGDAFKDGDFNAF